ncbi:MAG: peptidylprolyl isomerase [Rhodospirillaceae bacterium]
MRRWSRAGVVPMALAFLAGVQGAALAQAPAPGPTVVIETTKGTITIETYPSEAPKTVANFLALVKSNFYNRQHFHRAESFVIQVGDPNSKDLAKKDSWGRQGNGKPLGVAEISKKLTHKRGAVGMAHAGDPAKADSQFYITRQARKIPEGKYAIFGQVTSGMDVVDKIEVGDTIKRMYVK